MSELAQQIYATCAAEALFQEQGQENGIAAEELALIASFAFIAAAEFHKLEDMNYEERKKYTTTCAARLTASL
tara:strand:- start:4527 stop:4745 length:219 start_codon:yes stop_codon:yes gene_type:complete